MAWQKIKLTGIAYDDAKLPGHCPFCGDDRSVSYHGLDKDWDELTEECYCRNCQETFFQYYRLDFVEKMDAYNKVVPELEEE
jgi:transcription elongation factor Elf1